MKKILSILLLPLLFFLLVGARLAPVFFSSGEDKMELAFDVDGQKSKEAKEGKEAKEDKNKGEDLVPYHSSRSVFAIKVNPFPCTTFRLERAPYLPYQTPPPDCC